MTRLRNVWAWWVDWCAYQRALDEADQWQDHAEYRRLVAERQARKTGHP